MAGVGSAVSATSDRHFRNSTHREKIVEHLFIGELLRHFWTAGWTNVDILKPEVDANGYDLVATRGSIIRHIQLKASIAGGKTSSQKINVSLATQPSGCVVWIIVGNDLRFESFLWFGEAPGSPLLPLSTFKTATNTRYNKVGVKPVRESTKVIRKRSFKVVHDMASLVGCLFGDSEKHS